MGSYKRILQTQGLLILVFLASLALFFLVDNEIRTLIRPLRMYPWLEIMEWASFFGKGIILFFLSLIIFILGLLARKARKQEAGRYGIYALALSGTLAQVIKHLIGRPRPRLVNMGIFHLGPSFSAGYDSFPSGHTVSSFALAFILARFYPRGKAFFYGSALLVAFSRLYLDAHFVSDIFSGAVLGLLSGTAILHWKGDIGVMEIEIRQYLKDRIGLRKGS